MHEKQKLLSMIRKYDFVLYELQLYLDTHPRCPEALRMWKNYQAMSRRVPVTIFSSGQLALYTTATGVAAG